MLGHISYSFIHKLYLIKSRGKTIIYCGGTLTFLTLTQTHTISTGMNGRNLGPVSTTNGLTEQVFDPRPTFPNNPTNGLTEPGFVVILKQKRKISSNLLTNFVELLKINMINLTDQIYT
jgi:hypothetical protein